MTFLTESNFFKEFDYNMMKYMNSIKEASISKKNSIAVRSTALGNLDVILKMNKIQEKLFKWFHSAAVAGHPNWASVKKVYLCVHAVDLTSKLEQYLRDNNFEFEDQDFQELISCIKSEEGEGMKNQRKNLPEDAVHLIEFKLGVCSYNIVNPNLNENRIWLQFSKYSQEEQKLLQAMIARFNKVCNACIDAKLTAIAFDAEQTYVAVGQKVLVEQLNFS